jgi:hypothetical protein
MRGRCTNSAALATTGIPLASDGEQKKQAPTRTTYRGARTAPARHRLRGVLFLRGDPGPRL